MSVLLLYSMAASINLIHEPSQFMLYILYVEFWVVTSFVSPSCNVENIIIVCLKLNIHQFSTECISVNIFIVDFSILNSWVDCSESVYHTERSNWFLCVLTDWLRLWFGQGNISAFRIVNILTVAAVVLKEKLPQMKANI